VLFEQSPDSGILSPLTERRERRLKRSEFYPRAEKLQAAVPSTNSVTFAHANQPQYSTLYRDGE